MVPIVLAGIGCGNVEPPAAGPARDEIMFKVVASPGGEPLGKVVLTAATAEGLRELGETSSTGVVIVSADLLRELKPFAILFCHRDFFCGAMRGDVTLSHQHYMGLATIMID